MMVRRGNSAAGGAGELIVVAHPDDETLWLEPVLSPNTKVIVAFPVHPRDAAVTAARQRVREQFPIGTMEFMPLGSLDVLGRSDWRRRAPAPYGVELGPRCRAESRTQYVENYRRLRDLLVPLIEADSTVFTHNPWGEYGHEEHIQVCRAVLDTAANAGASVWAWDGFTTRTLARSSMRLRADFYERGVAGLQRITRSVDRSRYRELKNLYEREGAWTWRMDYEPPATMEFVELMRGGRELLVAHPPRRRSRTVGILADHVRHVPRVAKRLATRGRLRSG
jgi:hypothetical protein